MFGFILGALLALAAVRVFVGYGRSGGFRYLSGRDAAVLDAVGEAMFPAGGAIAASARDAGLISYMDDYFSWHSPANRFLMKLLFFLFEHATLVFGPSRRRLSALDPRAREEYLAGWDESRFYLRRMAFQSLRAMVTMAYLASAEVEAHLGVARPHACQEGALIQ